MNKADIINAMAADADITKKEAKKALESFLKNTKESLKKGNKVSLVGFGSWSVSKRAARIGRNPKTGESIRVPEKSVVKFVASKEISKVVSGGDTDHTGPRSPRKA